MYSLRKWLYKPKREDPSLLAQFFYADEELNAVAAELDSFDGRKDPDRCTALVNQLRQCQDKVLSICNQIMEEVIADSRANRDFRVKFPDDVLQESLSGQLWFGAECLAAGSSILNRDTESVSMRPLAKLLTKSLEKMRCLLREQCLRNLQEYSDKVKEALCNFDNLFAEFELSYVSAMVPVKTAHEYDLQQNLVVLFSETLQRALHLELLTQEKIDDYDPALMFTIPRLAIVCGLLIYPEGPLNMDVEPHELSEMFRPYHNLLRKIRDLLWTMSRTELFVLEKALSQMEAPDIDPLNAALTGYLTSDRPAALDNNGALDDVNTYVQQLYQGYPTCKQLVSEFCSLGMFRASATPAAQAAEGPQQTAVPRTGWQWRVDNRDPLSPERSSRRQQRVAPMPVPAQCPALNSRSRSPSCHSCQSSSSGNSATMWDTQSSCGSSTSSYTSEGPDDEEIALALQAAEIADREEARSRFRDSQDLVHRLFVCISGVADQLQSNYASDLRHILKCVFELNCSQLQISPPSSAPTSPTNSGSNTPTYGPVPESVESAEEASEGDDTSVVSHERLASNPAPPPWIPDELAPLCMSCVTSFTMLRRRHHCRNCGKVVCGRCSSNSVPLPHYGYSKCVRVCDHCLTFLTDS